MVIRDYIHKLKAALLPGDSVAGQAISGGIWESVSNVAGRLLQLIKLFVLARILSPEAFGIFGIGLLTVASLKWFSKLGISAALIQKSETNVNEYLNTAFSLKLARGLLLSGLLFLLAPFVADFFGEPEATDIVRAVAVTPLLGSLSNPGVMYLKKNLEFDKRFVLNVSTEVVNVAVAVAYAVVFETVWAFVFGLIASRVIGVVVSYLIHPYRPWPEFDWARAKDMISYGKWITATGPLLFLLGQGDDAFVGWLLGASALGFYRVAYRIGNAPGGEIAEVISNVAFPAYSKLQDNPDVLRKGYFRTLQLMMALVVPATFGIVLVARPFVEVFLGGQWLQMVPALQILTVYSAILAFSKVNNSLLMAIGRPDVNTKLQFVQLIVVAVLIYPASVAWGVTGTATAITAGIIVAKIPHLMIVLREINASLSQFVKPNVPPLVASIVMSGCVLLVLPVLSSMTTRPIAELLVAILVGVVGYSATILFIERHSSYRLINNLRDMIAKVNT